MANTLYFCRQKYAVKRKTDKGFIKPIRQKYKQNNNKTMGYFIITDSNWAKLRNEILSLAETCHKAFGEATAMLAGDVLLTEAFEAIANAPACPQACVQAAKALGLGAGSRGMVYGQELDLKYEALAATEEQLRLIHRNKTGALINAAVQMGAAAAGADADQCRALEAYAYGIGLVFQIVDDVLDVTSTPEQLGKPIGSDSENGKTTFATLYGVEGAMALAQRVNEKTCSALCETFGEKSAFLEQLAQQLLTRKN